MFSLLRYVNCSPVGKAYVRGALRGFESSHRCQRYYGRSLKHKIRSIENAIPYGRTVVGICQGVASGVAVVGVGAFCHYGLGIGTLNPSPNYLPEVVEERIRTTYKYFYTAVALSVFSGILTFRLLMRSPKFYKLVTHHGLAFFLVTLGGQFVIGTVNSGVKYSDEFGLKQFLYLCQSVLLGATVAPLYLIGGLALGKAAYVTSGLCCGLMTIGSKASPGTFLEWEKPLSVGSSVVFASFVGYCLGGSRLPGIGLTLYRIFMHGGLILFPAMFLYSSNNLVVRATIYPEYDPIQESMTLYICAVNIFARLAFLLGEPQYTLRDGPDQNTRRNSRSP